MATQIESEHDLVRRVTEDTTLEVSTKRSLAMGRLISFLAVLLTVLAIAWAIDLFRYAGLLLYTEQFLSGILAIAVPLVFLSLRKGKGEKALDIPWYDFVLAMVGFFCAIFMAFRYPALAELVSDAPLEGLIPGAVLTLLLIEGLRRTVGLVLTVLVLLFVLMGLFGHLLPGKLAGKEMLTRDFFYYLAWDPTSILGVPLKISPRLSLNAIISF